MSTKRKRNDPDLKARAALAVDKNEEVFLKTIAQFWNTPGLDHCMKMGVAGICEVSIFTWLRPKLGTNALDCVQYLPSGNLQTCRTSVFSWRFGIPDIHESTTSYQKNTFLPNKKAG